MFFLPISCGSRGRNAGLGWSLTAVPSLLLANSTLIDPKRTAIGSLFLSAVLIGSHTTLT